MLALSYLWPTESIHKYLLDISGNATFESIFLLSHLSYFYLFACISHLKYLLLYPSNLR